MKIVVLFMLLFFSISPASAYRIPVNADDQSTSVPLSLISTSRFYGSDEIIIHAALYPDGRLYWSPGYRDYEMPEDVVCCNNQREYSYSLYRAVVSHGEVESFTSQVQSYLDSREWGNRYDKMQSGRSFREVLFVENDNFLSLESGAISDFGANLHEFFREQDPTITPVPTPASAVPFFDDWDFVSNKLFDLVASHESEGVLIGPINFRTEFVSPIEAQ